MTCKGGSCGYGGASNGEDLVCSFADALRSGDEVMINERSRPLEVLGREEQVSHGLVKQPDYPYKIVWLRGNGTEYRLRYSHLGEYWPQLHTESQLVTTESFSPRLQDTRKKTYAKTAGRRVKELAVVGVENQTEWALGRNLSLIEEGVHGRNE